MSFVLIKITAVTILMIFIANLAVGEIIVLPEYRMSNKEKKYLQLAAKKLVPSDHEVIAISAFKEMPRIFGNVVFKPYNVDVDTFLYDTVRCDRLSVYEWACEKYTQRFLWLSGAIRPIEIHSSIDAIIAKKIVEASKTTSCPLDRYFSDGVSQKPDVPIFHGEMWRRTDTNDIELINAGCGINYRVSEDGSLTYIETFGVFE